MADIEEPEHNQNSPHIVVSSKVPGNRKLPKKSLILSSALFVAALLVIGGVVWQQHNNKPALTVGRYSYSKKEYADLINQAKSIHVSEQDARKALVKGLASREAADRLDVTYPTDETNLNDAAEYNYKVDPKDASKLTKYQRETAVYRVVEANMRLEVQGGYKASVVYLPFARYIYGFYEGSPTNKRGADVNLIGNPQAILSDMKHAHDKGEELRAAYSSGSKTIDQIAKEAVDDPVLEYGQASNHSGRVLLNSSQELLDYRGADVTGYLSDDIYQTIKNNQNNLGKPSELQEQLMPGGASAPVQDIVRGNNMAVGYYFVIVDKVVQPRTNLQSQYDSLVKELSNV